MRHLSRRFCLLAPLATLASPSALAQQPTPMRLFAASSLQGVLAAHLQQWSAATGTPVTATYDASSALARQLDNGAPADVFVSADAEWMDWAQQRKLIQPQTRVNILGNSLVLIAAQDMTEALAIAPGFPLAAALGNSRLAMGLPDSVPAGRYARAALSSLGVWADVAPKIAGANNVRLALALIARGEAKYGIVFGSDALAEPRVRVVGTFPATSHPAIVYSFALTAGSTNPGAALFLKSLSSPSARQIFETAGFTMLTGGE